MPLTLLGPMEAMRTSPTKRLAHCFKVVRADTTGFFLTDHDRIIQFPEDPDDAIATELAFTPVGSFKISAHRRETALESSNAEIRGNHAATAFTIAALIARKYAEAKITEYLVDWKFPWLGWFQKTDYWISAINFDGEGYRAQIEDVKRWFRSPAGALITRSCRYDLGSDGCATLRASQTTGKGVNLATGSNAEGAYTLTGRAIQDLGGGASPRLVFRVSNNVVLTGLSPSAETGYYNDARIQWITGGNQGDVSHVRDHQNVGISHTLSLQLPTGVDMVAGDTFTFIIECNKQFFSDCRRKFFNIENFGGSPYSPGADRARAPVDKL